MAAFGDAAVFKDVDAIPVGRDFGAFIREVISGCRIFLVMIGPQWVTHRNQEGGRSLDDPRDWVRIEIEIAFELGLQVIPVLVGGTPALRADELPDSLQALPKLHAANVRRDPDFHKDMEMLVRALEDGLAQSAQAQAAKLREEKEWAALGADASSEELADFIGRFPTGVFVSQAKKRLGEIERNARLLQAAYDRLRNTPPLAVSAAMLSEEEDAEWSKLGAEPQISRLTAFIRRYPNGRWADAAEQQIHEFHKERISLSTSSIPSELPAVLVPSVGSQSAPTGYHEGPATLETLLVDAIQDFAGPFALWSSGRRLVIWNASFARAFQLGSDVLRTHASYEAIAAASVAAVRRELRNPDHPDVRVIELATGEWLHIVERRARDGGIITVGVDITPLKRQEVELARNERRLADALTRAESQEYRIKALAREAHEERQKAEEASQAKTAFLANMSSELRTPINAVIGFSEIMAKELFGQIGNDQYKQYATDIYDTGNHLLALINDILDMAKIEAGKLTLAPRPLEATIVIEQAVRLVKRKAEEKGLSIVVDAESLPEIEADHRAVKQILLNLLSNAVKFTDSGAVMVHARGTARGLTLRVVDTGRGIPAEVLPRLARPFEQVDQSMPTSNAGAGLGLALTKSLVEMHGGKLSIQSELGRGTIVTVTLPKIFGGQPDPDAPAERAQQNPP